MAVRSFKLRSNSLFNKRGKDFLKTLDESKVLAYNNKGRLGNQLDIKKNTDFENEIKVIEAPWSSG